MITGRIFNIQHFSVHDGPGVRTVIFFKGCNLACAWCHNPESISFAKNIMLYPEKCIGCRACFENCPEHCHVLDDQGIHTIQHTRCRKCMTCTQHCYAEALVSVGEDVSITSVMSAILANTAYFRNAGGGVTFSGGECMLQIDFLLALLTACKENDIHTAVDTAGDVPWDFFERIRRHTDLFLYDIKTFDSAAHERLTGKPNHRILRNFTSLYETGARIIARIPYIKTMNNAEIKPIADFLRQYPRVEAEVLPYHALGNSKYPALGLQQHADWQSLVSNKEEIEEAKKLFPLFSKSL